MQIFDDLHLYEIVLLFLGVFLFVLLCAGLVYYVIKKDNIKKLLLFFPIPIIMIGYPSIKEIQIGNYKIALKESQERLLNNPDDEEAKNELTELTDRLEQRATTVKDLEAVSFSNLLLGNSDKVIDLTTKAIEKKEANIKENTPTNKPQVDPEAEKAEETKKANLKMLRHIKELAESQKDFQNNPGIVKDTLKLKEQISNIRWKNPKTEIYLNKKILQQKKTTEPVK